MSITVTIPPHYPALISHSHANGQNPAARRRRHRRRCIPVIRHRMTLHRRRDRIKVHVDPILPRPERIPLRPIRARRRPFELLESADSTVLHAPCRARSNRRHIRRRRRVQPLRLLNVKRRPVGAYVRRGRQARWEGRFPAGVGARQAVQARRASCVVAGRGRDEGRSLSLGAAAAGQAADAEENENQRHCFDLLPS